MKKSIVLIVSFVVMLSGCSGGDSNETGFLSDYSKLQKESNSVMRYVDEKVARQYTAFIIDPIEVHFHQGSKSEGKLSDQKLLNLTDYVHAKVGEAIKLADRKVVNNPGPNVARIRVALTDITKSSAVSLIPQASILGVGIGGASMEAEALDSMTGKQIGASIQSGKGSRVPFTNLGELNAAKKAIDGWAKEFQKRLEEYR